MKYLIVIVAASVLAWMGLKLKPVHIAEAPVEVCASAAKAKPQIIRTLQHGFAGGVRKPVSVLTMSLGFGVIYKPGEKWITGELDEYTDPVVTTTTKWTTSYDVQRVAGRGTHLLVVLGTARDGELTVIERWDLTPTAGTPTLSFTQATVAVGTPVSTPAPVSAYQGGSWILPASRPAPTAPTRTECYRGPLLGEDLEIEVDPDGRFVLVLARGQGKLYRVLLEEDTTPVVILDDSQSPSLGYADGLQTFRHFSQGRQVSALLKGSPLARLVLYDYDNDGEFDHHAEYSDAEEQTQGLPEAWVEDYTNYSGAFAPHQW